MIDIEKLSISFDRKKVLDEIDLKFPRTGLFCICGESGSGKSSLLNAISSLISYKGRISIDGIEPNKFSEEDKATFRLKNIGFIFQDFKLFINQNVEQNVCFPLGVLSNCSDSKKLQKCNDLLKICGLQKYNKRICGTLSGGEKQRVAIARALINNPKIIIADEPTGSLDEKTGLEIMSLLKSFSNKSLVLMVTHDVELARKFANTIIFIKDGKIGNIEELDNKIKEKAKILTVKEKQRNCPILPFSFAINHAKQSVKNKKLRSILSTMFMSLGLLGIGLSISFSNSISEDIKRSYSSLIETANISVVKKSEQEQLNVLTYEDAKNLVDKYKDKIDIECGVGYKANFEELFKDCNEVVITNENGGGTFIDELSIRNVNDFYLLKEISESIFPDNITKLEDDEIVLGLTIQEIRSICYYFDIEKSVESLSNYLKENAVYIVLETGNIDWEYSDQQIFTLKGFTLTKEPYFAHSNILFNKIVLEDKMRFPTTEKHGISDYPWVLDKITYIQTSNNYEFISLMRENEELSNYAFELCDKSLFVNKLLNKEFEQINYLIPYYLPLDVFSEKEMNFVKSVDQNLNDMLIYNRSCYVNYPSSLISGFGHKTYFSLNEEDLAETLENNASVEFSQNEEEILKQGVISSNYAAYFDNPVKMLTNFDGLIDGRKPIDLDEIVVSKGLLNRLNSSDNQKEFLYVSNTVQEINKDAGIYNRDYVTNRLKIVGITSEEKSAIYHESTWTIDYFTLKVGMKIKEVLPSSISFSIDQKCDSNIIINKLNRAFPQYEIINPLSDINSSVDSLTKSISIFIFLISSVSLIISLILLSSCAYLHVQDIKTEVSLARCIGVTTKESLKFLNGFTLYSSCLALIISAIELTITNATISYMSAEILRLPFEFSMSYLAYLVMVVGCISICFITTKLIAKYIKKIKPIDCLKI